MDILEAMQQRHSVRSYLNRPIDPAVSAALRQTIETCNRESGLHIQLVTDEPKAFDSTMAHYGKFSGVTNYIAIIGRKEAGLNERCGYYGEKIVLQAQMLGLNTCWVGLTFKKIPDAFQVAAGEKLVIVIAIGYGASPGTAHPTRPMDAVSRSDGPMPAWFRDGVAAALLAPTAVNQQKFTLILAGDRVWARAGLGFFSKVDLGIVKYHFEIGSGTGPDIWLPRHPAR